MRIWGPERFDPNVIDRQALDAAVSALSKTWKPRWHKLRSNVQRQLKGPQSYAYDLLAIAAGELLAYSLDQVEATRDLLQRPDHILTDLRQPRSTAAGTGCLEPQ